jgi:DNA-directed RNA polymerase alpha subunit
MRTPVRDLKKTLPDRFADELKIEEVGLDTRLLGALVNEGFKTVGDVRDMSDAELRCVRRIGNRNFRVLRNLFGPSRSINATDFDREEAR